MRTMHAALAEVARHLGMAQIVPDADGFAELVVDGELSVFLRTVEEDALELSARVPEFDGRLSPPVLEALLRWNGRFHGLRFAFDADRNGVVLGRRLHLGQVETGHLARMVEAFILSVADWRRSGANALVQGVVQHDEGGFSSLMSGLRL